MIPGQLAFGGASVVPVERCAACEGSGQERVRRGWAAWDAEWSALALTACAVCLGAQVVPVAGDGRAAA